MSRRRSTSSSHNLSGQNHNHKPCLNHQINQNIPTTSEIYNQAYQTLTNNDYYQSDSLQNTPVPNYHSIPPPHRNNLKPVNSPLRRPHSSTDDLSELEDCEKDPSTKLIYHNRKKTKMNNNTKSN
ncbi:unnamed protein product, partial [Rotaria sp. Silwood1]